MASLALLFHLVDRAEAIAAGESAGPVSLPPPRALPTGAVTSKRTLAASTDWPPTCNHKPPPRWPNASARVSLTTWAGRRLHRARHLPQAVEPARRPRDRRRGADRTGGRRLVAAIDVQAAGWQMRGHVRYRVNPKARHRNGLGPGNG
jgi:hypothetical protein